LLAPQGVEALIKHRLPTAKALNGDDAMYFTHAPDPAKQKKFVIWMMGGGVCADQTDCLARKRQPLGGDKYPESITKDDEEKWFGTSPITMDGAAGESGMCDVRGVLSAVEEENPDFHDWHHVPLPPSLPPSSSSVPRLPSPFSTLALAYSASGRAAGLTGRGPPARRSGSHTSPATTGRATGAHVRQPAGPVGGSRPAGEATGPLLEVA
jgi:hypothetical protein